MKKNIHYLCEIVFGDDAEDAGTAVVDVNDTADNYTERCDVTLL